MTHWRSRRKNGLGADPTSTASLVTPRACVIRATRSTLRAPITRSLALPLSIQRVVRFAILALGLTAGCAKGANRAGPSNDLLIVGYDREPDTMNRYSTHILEDIQSCVVEGLSRPTRR